MPNQIHGWLRLSVKPQTIIIRSVCYSFSEHYFPEGRESALCMGAGCLLCEANDPRPAWCLAVSKTATSDLYLLKLTPGLEELAQDWISSRSRIVGLRVSARLITDGKFRAREILELDRTEAVEIDVTAYVSAIGRKAYLLHRDRLTSLPQL